MQKSNRIQKGEEDEETRNGRERCVKIKGIRKIMRTEVGGGGEEDCDR